MKKKAQQNIVGTFKVNLNAVKGYDDSDKYMNLVQQEIENGNGFVKVKSMSGDKAEIYGAGSNSWVLGGVFVPFEALEKVNEKEANMTTKERRAEMDKKTKILWGIPKGKTDRLDEELLLSNAINDEHIEKIKALAEKDGWHSFRVSVIDDKFPDFTKTINKSAKGSATTTKKEEKKPQCKVIEDRAQYVNEPQTTPLIERIPRTMPRVGSDRLINNVSNVPDVQGPVEESDAKPIKPREEQMTEQKAKELEVNEGLVSPEIVVEWAMRDAQANQGTVLEEIERLTKDYGLTDKQKEDAMEYYEKIRSRNQRDASYLYKIVDEVGNGFKTFPEAFSYMTMDMTKEEKYRLKRVAKKAGLLSE
jgi:hypothetical protein